MRAFAAVLGALVVDRGDTQPVQLRLGFEQRGLQFGRGGRRDETLDQSGRQLAQNAGRLAMLVAVDEAAGRVRRSGVDPGQPERGTVGDGHVHIGAQTNGGLARLRDAVQIVTRGEGGLAPPTLVPPLPKHPFAGPTRMGVVGNSSQHFLTAARGSQLEPTTGHRPFVEVDMGVAQPRQRQPPAEVDAMGGGVAEARHVLIRTDGDNGVVADDHGLRPGLGGVGGVDAAIREQKRRWRVMVWHGKDSRPRVWR